MANNGKSAIVRLVENRLEYIKCSLGPDMTVAADKEAAVVAGILDQLRLCKQIKFEDGITLQQMLRT